MKKSILLFIACAVSLAQCDVWDKPIIEQILKEAEEFDLIEKIMVTKYPFPNTFIRDDEILADLKNGGADLWESKCALELSGITSGGEMRKLTAEEYTVESFDLDAFNDGSEIPVKVTLNGASGATTSFYIAVISLSENYHTVKIAAGINNGILVPFPSGQKEGGVITVYAYPDDGYVYKKNSISNIPPSSPEIDFSYKDKAIIFTMPGGDVTLTAEFFEAAAKLETGGIVQYFETLEAAFGAVSSGEEADITVLTDIITVQNGISVNGNVTLAAANGKEKTVKRGESFLASFFIVNGGASLTLDAGNCLGLALDGENISANAPLVEVSGGTLTMNERVTLRNNNSGDGGGVRVNGGVFTMTGGAISGNTANGNSGGVRVNGGMFTMTGGMISGNTAGSNGGGVRVDGGMFTMTGGMISGNTAGSNGGGVLVKGGTFTMEGGAISGNTSAGKTDISKGGGVLVGGGAFTMTGGAISGNKLADNGSGGGVFVNGSFTMSGTAVVKQDIYLTSGKKITVSGALKPPEGEYSAEIKLENTSNGTVALEGDAYTLKNEDVKKFTLTLPNNGDTFLLHNNNKGILADLAGLAGVAGDALYFNGDTPSYAPTLADAISGIGAATATVYLVQDEITVASNIPVSGDVTLTVLGDGEKTVERGSGFTTDSLFTVNTGASLTLDAGNGSLALDGKNITATAPIVTVSGGALTMGDEVALKNNKRKDQSGNSCGIWVYNGGIFTMTGGAIIGNKMLSHYGGGVCVEGNNSRFEMSGGTISYNEAGSAGGVSVTNGSAFEMTGGEISNNKALDGNGGGVFVGGVSNSRFTMQGGTISGNTAHLNGGGVFVGNNSAFEMSGDSTISGNTVIGKGGGVYLEGGNSTFTMSGNSTISNNEAADGGGVYQEAGEFTMSGGVIISGNESDSHGGGVYVKSGTLTMNGGEISQNTANTGGGGAHIHEGASAGNSGAFIMKDGKISSNETMNGGGVSVGNYGYFTMENGEISHNTATGYGGGVFQNPNGTFTMNGGKINFNDAPTGGGLHQNNISLVHLNGGTIVSNTPYDISP